MRELVATMLDLTRARPRRRGSAVILSIAVAVLLALTAATSSAWAPPRIAALLMASACALTALAPVIGVVLHRPADHRLWLGVSLMLGLWSGNALTYVSSGPGWLSTAFVCAGQAVAVLLAIAVIRTHRAGRSTAPEDGARPAPTVPATGRSPFRSHVLWKQADGDGLLLAVNLALVLAHQTASLLGTPADQRNWVQGVPAVDVLLAAMLVRFLVSRSALPRATVLVMTASLVTIAYDLLVTSTGRRTVPATDPLNAVYIIAATLFAAASLHPTVALPLSRALSRRRRSESARLLALVPLAIVPVGLFALSAMSSHDSLPTWVYVAAEAGIAAAALIKGAKGVRAGEHNSGHDALTGLANRRGLIRALEGMHAETAGDLELVLLDVRGFAHVNDTYGHDGGDAFLVQVGVRLHLVLGLATPGTRVARRDGRLAAVARTGADHFAVLIPAPSPAELHPRSHDAPPTDADADRAPVPAWLDAVFCEAFSISGRRLMAGVRAGTVVVHPGTSAGSALADAEVALHAAKATGSPPGRLTDAAVVAYTPSLREVVRRRLQLAADLQRVLDGDETGGHLLVHYQPLVELVAGSAPETKDFAGHGTGSAVVGVEALVRWHHPQHGLIAPDDFLNIAEDYALAARLDFWVLRTALATLAGWDRVSRRRLFLSTNLGRSSMMDPDLQIQVINALAETGIAADRLHLEITEHDALPADAGTDALAALALDGVHISLDDFGIGYTSLEYLLRYPVSLLKLDRSLTQALQHSSSSQLIEGVLALAGALQIPVLAEGIETTDQQQRLAGAGVQYGQGYLFSRPLLADALLALLQEGQVADQGSDTSRLQAALTSREKVEQAKGVLAHTGGISVEAAFTLMRFYARMNTRRLSEVAREVLERRLPPEAVLRYPAGPAATSATSRASAHVAAQGLAQSSLYESNST